MAWHEAAHLGESLVARAGGLLPVSAQPLRHLDRESARALCALCAVERVQREEHLLRGRRRRAPRGQLHGAHRLEGVRRLGGLEAGVVDEDVVWVLM
jgi:hypothetical protein